jgi:hypothetical protein
MTDYRELSNFEKNKVDNKIKESIEPKHHINKNNGFEWDEPSYTLSRVHEGDSCAECYCVWYNCLCSHD